jgi:hypothetical protein
MRGLGGVMLSFEDRKVFRRAAERASGELYVFNPNVLRDMIDSLDELERRIESVTSIMEQMAEPVREISAILKGRGLFKEGHEDEDNELFHKLVTALNSYEAVKPFVIKD